MAHGITSRDQMFAVKTAPWHKLGVVVEKAPTIAEAIKLAHLDWEVYKDALLCGDGTKVNAYAIRRKDTGEVIGDAVGPRFQPLQNTDAFQWFSPFLESGLASLETAGSLFSGSRVFVLAKLNRKGSEITPGDTVDKYLLLAHAHDGTLAVRCGYTPIRVVCNNTLSAAVAGKKTSLLSMRHTASLQDGMAQAQELIAKADADFEKVADVFRSLAGKSITGSQFRQYVKDTLSLGKPDTEEMSTKGRNILEKVIGNMDENQSLTRELLANHQQRQEVHADAQQAIGAKALEEMLTGNLEVGRGAVETTTARGPSWWTAYNAITEFLTHQRGHNQQSRLDQAWFGAGATLNNQALTNAIAGAAV